MLKSIIKDYSYHIALHLTILVWGFTGILGKIIAIPYYSIVWYRMLIAAFGLFAYAAFTKFKLKSTVAKATLFISVGFIVAAHWCTFFFALKISNVSVVLTTMASTSLFVALIEPLFFRRRVLLYELVLGLLVIVGIGITFNFEKQYAWGILFALISAFLAALFSTINGVLIKKNNAKSITFYEMIGGVLGVSIYVLFFENPTVSDFYPSLLDVFYLLVLGLICTAVAFVVSVEVMKKLSPFTVSVSVNLEPFYAIILALIFFGNAERMTYGFYLGAGIIFSTVLINGLVKHHKKQTR